MKADKTMGDAMMTVGCSAKRMIPASKIRGTRTWKVRCLLAFLGIAAVALLPPACDGGGSASGGGGNGGTAGSSGVAGSSGTNGNGAHRVGTACQPSNEADFQFSGYSVTENIIEMGTPQCEGGVCLVNHAQGMVSCPLGQPMPVDAQGLPGCVPNLDAAGNYVPGQGSCKDGATCTTAGSHSPKCGPPGSAQADNFCKDAGAGVKCSGDGYCECETDADCAFVTTTTALCEPKLHQCISYVCHRPGECQIPVNPDWDNAGKACCQPGKDIPFTSAVCGQCKGSGDGSPRDINSSVYCSCRCGVAEGAPAEPDADFCTCPDGSECTEIRPYVGTGDPKLSGKYCILKGTEYDANLDQCGLVDGYWGPGCAGTGTGKCQTAGGPCL